MYHDSLNSYFTSFSLVSYDSSLYLYISDAASKYHVSTFLKNFFITLLLLIS